MPVIIFKPRQYAAGFATADPNTVYTYDDALGRSPKNGDIAPPPNDKDVKVCEISRFEGWTTEYFCDVGEFEITTRDVLPGDVTTDNLVYFDGRIFVIERINWELDNEGYICTFGGRDMWKYAESVYIDNKVGVDAGTINGLNVFRTVEYFFNSAYSLGMWDVGWWRDKDRKGRRVYEFANSTYDEMINKKVNLGIYSTNITRGAAFRHECNLLKVGFTIGAEYNASNGLFGIVTRFRDARDNGIIMSTSDSGISSLIYEIDTRNETNSTFAFYDNDLFELAGSWWTGAEKYGKLKAYGKLTSADVSRFARAEKRWFWHAKNDDCKNYAEREHRRSERLINIGEPSQEIKDAMTPDTTDAKNAFAKWLNESATEGYEDKTVVLKFEYDWKGRYKFGEDIRLGDMITVKDDFLGLSTKQQLTGVKKTYKAGSGVSYEFDFSNQRISTFESLKRRLDVIDRRTFGLTTYGQ